MALIMRSTAPDKVTGQYVRSPQLVPHLCPRLEFTTTKYGKRITLTQALTYLRETTLTDILELGRNQAAFLHKLKPV